MVNWPWSKNLSESTVRRIGRNGPQYRSGYGLNRYDSLDEPEHLDTLPAVFTVLGFILFGTVDVLTLKLADRQTVKGRSNFPKHKFCHAFLQVLGVFVVEAIYLVIFQTARALKQCRRRKRHIRSVTIRQPTDPFQFAIPAVCDLIACTMALMGLHFLAASTYQMLRLSLVVFTILLSVTFLQRHMELHKWIGATVVITGLTIVGVQELYLEKSHSNLAVGYILVIASQVVKACQYISEEKFVAHTDVHPIEAMGWEGVWGGLILGAIIVPASMLAVGSTLAPCTVNHTLADAWDGILQITNSRMVMLGFFGNMASVGLYRLTGMVITKYMGGAQRAVLDNIRVFIIWIISVSLGWQKCVYLSVIGFLISTLGILWYHDVGLPQFLKPRQEPSDSISIADEAALLY